MTEQYYRLTLKDAISKYQTGDLTAKGLVHFYILIKCKAGWKVRLEHQKVCKELGIRKTAFYSAISRLRVEGSIDWEAPEGILVSISSTFRECGIDYSSAESEFTSAESRNAIAELKSPKASSHKGYGNSPDLLLDSYQTFTNSLSEEEKESFLKFGEEKALKLPKPPQLPQTWIKKHYQEIAREWYKSKGNTLSSVKEAQNAKWENHPHRDEWLQKIRTMGHFSFCIESGKQDLERDEFFHWAQDSGLFEGEY